MCNFQNVMGFVSKVQAHQCIRRLITHKSMRHIDHEALTRSLDDVPFNICDLFDNVNDTACAEQYLLSPVIDILLLPQQRFHRKIQVPPMGLLPDT